jgi:S1-C subfamily serine protease
MMDAGTRGVERDDTTLPPTPRFNALRWLLVGITALLIAGSLFAFVAATVSHDLGDLGFDTGRSTFIVSSVKPASPAALAGLRPGDEVRFGDMSPHDQLAVTRYGRQLLTSDVVRIVYARNGAVHRAVVHFEPLSLDQKYFH